MTKTIIESSIGKLTKYVVDSGRNMQHQYDKRKELRDAGKHKDPEMDKTDDNLRKRQRGLSLAANAIHRKIDNKQVREEAVVNNVGSGAIAGAGIGAMGEPGVSKKAQRKHNKNQSTPTPVILSMLRRKAPNGLAEETFAGATVFEVSSKIFHNLTHAKRKGKHWRTYLDEDDSYAEIREWARKNKGPIVVRNECTGEMRYVRYRS
jgi:hypothetical protein